MQLMCPIQTTSNTQEVSSQSKTGREERRQERFLVTALEEAGRDTRVQQGKAEDVQRGRGQGTWGCGGDAGRGRGDAGTRRRCGQGTRGRGREGRSFRGIGTRNGLSCDLGRRHRSPDGLTAARLRQGGTGDLQGRSHKRAGFLRP